MTDSPDDAQPTEALTRRARRDADAGGRARAPKAGAATDGTAKPAATGGIRAIIAKHPVAWLASAIALVFVLLATGAVFAGVSAGIPAAAQPEQPTEEVPDARPQPAEYPAPASLRTCSIADDADAKLLGDLRAAVIDTETGELLYDREATTAAPPGYVQQVMTAAAALDVLGKDATLQTKVLDGSAPGTIVLVGGGDPTLSTSSKSFYDGAPRISDLAQAAMVKYNALHPGVPVTQIVLDSTLWSTSDDWNDDWPESDRTGGYLPKVTALMVDGDRKDPSKDVSPRGTDPVSTAGKAFAEAAGLTGVTFTEGTAIGSTLLAEVSSQKVSTLIEQMLATGDNAIAENLARVVSVESTFGGESSSLQQAISAPLSNLGLDGAGELVIKDGSGTSTENAAPPQVVAQLMALVLEGDDDLDIIKDALPVAGETGDLANRFTGDNDKAKGEVRARPGAIVEARSLAGIITADDGTKLTFAFYALGGDVTFESREALDTLATAVFECGANLSNT